MYTGLILVAYLAVLELVGYFLLHNMGGGGKLDICST
jgi:hypothetical protein